MTTALTSLATAQRSLADPSITYPLFPVLSTGCPQTSTAEVQYPLALAYEYERLDRTLFAQSPLPGLERWGPLLPPLAEGLSMGEGGTPLVTAPRLADWAGFNGELYIKDESRNPTSSHKDRLNLCTVSAALRSGAPGITVASSGNHGAAAAAYAARAGLPCVLFITEGTEPHILRFVQAYGTAIVMLPRAMRRVMMRELVERAGYHPVSSITPTHTGHPFGPEGYKTIAFELFLQLDRRVPAAVLVPTAYAELLYGIWMGFQEMAHLGITDRLPRMVACEPAAAAPLHHALRTGRTVMHVDGQDTGAYSIVVDDSSYRGYLAVTESGGCALPLDDAALLDAQRELGRAGLWAELSGAAGAAGLKAVAPQANQWDGPVVAVMTSTGFKDQGYPPRDVPAPDPTWTAVQACLRDAYGLAV
jgi:threonine synthase